MRTKATIVACALALALCPPALRAGDAPLTPTCVKRSFKAVKTVTPFSITHRINSKKVIYDDIGCALKWREKQCSSGQGTFDAGAKVYDFNTLAEIEISTATFVQSPAITSPMGFGLTAFTNAADADTFLAKKGAGKKLTYPELLLLNWK